ncbi:MAG: gamma-glutamyltransferase [Bacillota bacterium]|jgi:gamma-glutamyltranspeptidase/glutathione hydrolase
MINDQHDFLRPEVVGNNGMVAAAHPLAAQAGRDILAQGGNAIDAAVATAFTISVVEPFASGLGGGGYAVVHLAESGKTVFVDYQSTAPGLSTPDMYLEHPEDRSTGYRSTMVPGYLAGLCALLKRYGTLSLQHVMAAAIKYAEEGFVITPYLHSMMVRNHAKLLANEWASKYFLVDGLPYEPGQLLVNTDLANTLRAIAEQGPDAFYRGEPARLIEQLMIANDGLIRRSDLANARPAFREPISMNYRGYEIKSSAPTSSGGITIAMILNMLEEFDVAALGHNSAEALHLWAEVARRAYADRSSYIGDPNFVQPPITGLLSKAYARERISDFDPLVATAPTTGNPYPYNESPSTTHMSVIDNGGNAVAITQTLCSFFGNGIGVPGQGFLLNNQGEAWYTNPESMNSVAPHKRPLSSMSPTVVLKDGQPFLSLGSPGSRRIITTTAQIISNVIDHGMGMQQAIEAARMYADGPNFAVEDRISAEVIRALELKGHQVEVKGSLDDFFGGVNAVMYDERTGKFYGGADPRRDGYAAGC